MARKLVESTFVTLDGVIGDPQVWGAAYWDDQFEAYATRLLERADALLLGRATYEVFAGSWPHRTGDPYADQINAMPKYVASTTLTDPEWNTTVLEGDTATAVAALKAAGDGDLVKFGTGELDRTLLEHGLVDELHFWVHPVLAGSGTRLLDGLEPTGLRLVDVDRFESGIVVMVCAPA